MLRPLRLVALSFLACAAFADLCAAQDKAENKNDPKSNNTGKIVGKWKVTEYPKEHAPAYEQLATLGFWMYIEFKSDNVLVLGVGADKPETLKLLQSAAEGGSMSWDAKYRLLAVDEVAISGAKAKELKTAFSGENTKASVTIKDDVMTMKDPEGKVTKLTKLKPAKNNPKDKPEK